VNQKKVKREKRLIRKTMRSETMKIHLALIEKFYSLSITDRLKLSFNILIKKRNKKYGK